MGLNIKFTNPFKFADMAVKGKILMDKLKIPLLVVVGVAVVALVGFGVYKWAVNLSNNAVTAAHAQGIAEANSKAAQAANQQMIQAVQNLQKMEADTQKKMQDLRVLNDKEKKSIDTYDAKTIAVDHPEQVEKWANDTVGGLFNDIQSESTPKAQGAAQ